METKRERIARCNRHLRVIGDGIYHAVRMSDNYRDVNRGVLWGKYLRANAALDAGPVFEAV